jgi:hypothetical protein
MGLHAPAVEILIEKAGFAPEVALGVAEAIESSIMNSQFVTVPVLDARLQEVRADIRVLEGEVRTGFRELEAKMEAKMDVKLEKLRPELERLRTELEKLRSELVRWVFLVMPGSVALSLSASAITNYLKSL